MSMSVHFCLACVILSFQNAEATLSESMQETLARVPDVGLLRGLQHKSDGVRVFAGIPYAQPPVGDLRWRQPNPLPKSQGEVDARSFGQPCPQASGSKVIGQEDCLTLNVFAPREENHSADPLPVLVFFHGGDFVKGTTNIYLNGTWGPLYNGQALAAQGVVVVTVQYRLAILGFLGSSELRKRDPLGSSGNYGVQDQRLALQWVRQHISAFGGNPKRVTIFGQSAGAGSISFHLIAKASRGLFHAAVLQSGACAPWSSQTWDQAESSFKHVQLRAKCTTVECLLTVPASDLIIATNKNGAQDLGWAPTADGVEMDALPCAKMSQGDFAKVPIIVGFNRDESAPDGNIDMTETEFDKFLEWQVPKHVHRKVKADYSAMNTAWFWAAQRIKADMSVSCPTRKFVHAATKGGAPVYAYKFSHQPDFDVRLMYGQDATAKFLQQQWGAYHGADLAFVFGNPRIPGWGVSLSPGDSRLASIISKKWVQFAKTGQPSADWFSMSESAPYLSKWLLLDSPNVTSSEAQLLGQCATYEEEAKLPSITSSASQPTVIIM